MTKRTVPSHATRESERATFDQAHEAGRPATAEESELADTNTPDRRVTAHEQEMLGRGAAAKGEGRPG